MMAVMILAAVLLWAKHGDWLKNANDCMLLDSPDAFKNYMTSAWHVRYDAGYTHYEGMNYPYGEHVLFTDNQPVFSAALQWWSRHVSDISADTVGLMNWFQIISMLLGACAIFLLLRKLHIPVWYAGIASLGILFLSPQNNRFDTHFGLSHTWILPLLLLLLCRYEERFSRRYQSLLIGILLFFSAQLHFYNFGVSAIFLGLYTLYQILTDFRWKNIAKRSYHLIVMVVLPFTLLNLWVHWSDYCPDRPTNPWGFTHYIAHWEGIFLPYENMPVFQWIDRNIIHIRRIDPESQAYVGVIAFAFTLWVVFKRKFRMFDPSWDSAAFHRVHKRYMNGVFAAGFALVLIGCGFPFAIPGMEWMVDYLGPFRQFRGLGRFTWIYYYAVNLLVFYVLWNKSSHYRVNQTWKQELDVLISGIKNRQFRGLHLPNTRKWTIALLPLFIMCWETLIFQKLNRIETAPSPAQPGAAASSPDHWLNKVDYSGFQALMPLPYYHVGSENIWLDICYPLFKKTQYTAYQTGIPDMGVFMSRSSIGRMVKSVQWSLPPCETPAIFGDLSDFRPIALLIEPAKWEEVQKKYAHLISKASTVYESPELRIMSLMPDSVRVYARERMKKVESEASNPNLQKLENGWMARNLNGKWFRHLSFDDNKPEAHNFSGSSAKAVSGDTTWLVKEAIPKGVYHLNLWINVAQDMGMTQELKIVQNNITDGHQINFRHEGLRFYIETIVGDWALFNVEFTVYEDNSITGAYLHKKGVFTPFWYDEVLIKPGDADLYWQAPGFIVKNNHWFRR
jgi:hypothetical protein